MKYPSLSWKIKTALALVLIITSLLYSVRLYNSRSLHVENETRLMMDTYVTISAVGTKEDISRAVDLALDRMQEINVKFNHLNPKSPIYAFNNRGEPITDPELIGLIAVALKVSEESGGAFDITVGPLAELWKFYEKSPRLPQDREIKDRLKDVGYRHLSLENGVLKKDASGVKIDLGGIAKGYALSQAAITLKANKIDSALIDAGGDIFALGKKGEGAWRVGIRNPRGDDLLGYVEVSDLAVISSGDYERFFVEGGRRYHHIFDPRTGYPTEGVRGVTLIHPDPVLAQAWAKVPFIVGPKQGMEILEKIPDMQAMIITSSGEVLYSSDLFFS